MQNAVLGTRGQAAEKSIRSLLSWNFQSSGNQQEIIQISALEHIAINALRERSWVLWENPGGWPGKTSLKKCLRADT